MHGNMESDSEAMVALSIGIVLSGETRRYLRNGNILVLNREATQSLWLRVSENVTDR